MYKLLLILKYLRKRRIAWVSLIAVMLCTTMVLVVISVMGGWLRMFRESFNGLSGDIIVNGESLVGFPHYQEMIDKIQALPEVEAAIPVIESFALINVGNRIRKGVQVVGYTPDVGRVNHFPDSLHLYKGEQKVDFALRPDIEYTAPRTMVHVDRDVKTWPGMIVGGGVIGLRKDKEGNIDRPEVMYSLPVTLTVLPIPAYSSVIDPTTKQAEFFWIVDDSRTKVYLYDSNTVYVPFKTIQTMLQMQGDDQEPARANEIQVKVRDGANVNAVKDKVESVVRQVEGGHDVDMFRFPIEVKTWEEQHAVFIGAIEKEKGLVTILFGIISIVAIFLIFCIFYMIVVEKTRDIGIIKSVGATAQGVAGIFLGYGLAIGIVGGGMGLGLAYLIVHNINELHTWLGKVMHVQVWNPEVYLFDTIPNRMEPHEVTVIVSIAIIASVAGALLPAIRAAGLHPVEALRYE
jgi:lipoprotein-releasing system permease protein